MQICLSHKIERLQFFIPKNKGEIMKKQWELGKIHQNMITKWKVYMKQIWVLYVTYMQSYSSQKTK